MQEADNDTSVTNEDTEILNLPLYTERKADDIYCYSRHVPKPMNSPDWQRLPLSQLG